MTLFKKTFVGLCVAEPVAGAVMIVALMRRMKVTTLTFTKAELVIAASIVDDQGVMCASEDLKDAPLIIEICNVA